MKQRGFSSYSDTDTESETIDDLSDAYANSPWSTPRLLSRQIDLSIRETFTPVPVDYKQQTNGSEEPLFTDSVDLTAHSGEPRKVEVEQAPTTVESSTSPTNFPVPHNTKLDESKRVDFGVQSERWVLTTDRMHSFLPYPQSVHIERLVSSTEKEASIPQHSTVTAVFSTRSIQLVSDSEDSTQVGRQKERSIEKHATVDVECKPEDQKARDVPNYLKMPEVLKEEIPASTVCVEPLTVSPKLEPTGDTESHLPPDATQSQLPDFLLPSAAYDESYPVIGGTLEYPAYPPKTTNLSEDTMRKQRLKWMLNHYREPVYRLKSILQQPPTCIHYPPVTFTGLSSNLPEISPCESPSWYFSDVESMEVPDARLTLDYESSDELLPYSRDSWWPTRPAEDFYDNLPARRFMNDTAASRSRSVSRPKRRTRSPSNWKTENSRYGEYTLMDKSRPRDTKVKTRTKFAEETAKQMSTSEKPELLRKAQSTSNVSVTPSKPLIKKYHPPGLVKKLRRRCDSIDRELDRLADSRPQLDGSSPVDSDPTMESLTVANQALHDRLTELRTLQRKRDKNLKKARALVDDLITEQKVHSDQIRSNAPPDSQTSSGSSSPLQFSQEVSIRTSNKPFPITRRKPGEVLFRSCDLGEFKWDRKGSPLKLYSTAGEGSDGRNVDRIEKLNEQANCTKNVLERLREDFADLSRNVTRVEAKARDAAQAVNMLVNQARYLEDDQCFGPCDACKHTMRCRCLSQADTKPRVTTSIPKARIPSSSPNTISYVPPRLDNRNNTYSVKRNSPYRSVGWEFRE